MNMRGVRSREQAVIERQVGELVRVVDELFDVASHVPGRPGHRLHSIPPPPDTEELASHSAFGKGKRVLIVASNEDAAEILAALLKRLYFTVEIAHDSDAALRCAKSFQPEIALLDVDLPNVDGYNLARRLRNEAEDIGNFTLVALTGDELLADPERTTAAGFRACLVKPLDPQALTQLLAKLC
jgi:CheY-like chemotaxis protein